MLGYGLLSLPGTGCVHLVRVSELDATTPEIVEELRLVGVRIAYLDYAEIRGGDVSLNSQLGSLLELEHVPYSGDLQWTAFLDDLITLSSSARGLVIVIDNADLFLSEARDEFFDLIESFLIQVHHWIDQGKPCHLCLQMEKSELIRKSFSQLVT